MTNRTQARETFTFILVMTAVVLTFSYCTGGCRGDGASDEELAYRAALLRCVDKATTLAESKACRKQADATFGVDSGAR